MNKAVAAAATLTTITALAVTTTQDDEQEAPTWKAASTTMSEVQLAPDAPRREDAQVRASRTRTNALRIDAAQAAAAAAAQAAQEAAAKTAATKAADAAADREAERRAVAHQAEHDRADQAARELAERERPTSEMAASGTSAPAAATSSSSGSTDAGREALGEAPNHAGKSYEWGATGPDTFDCSGFTSYLFERQGTQLPRTARDQYAASDKVDKGSKQPGDLIFTYGSDGIYHVGIYAGDGAMWAATKSGDVVRRQEIWTSQYYVGRVS
ncbi:MAG: hydrolase [Frankiales bacterium]|nr:hydrolase [Frankiales bacterium]